MGHVCFPFSFPWSMEASCKIPRAEVVANGRWTGARRTAYGAWRMAHAASASSAAAEVAAVMTTVTVTTGAILFARCIANTEARYSVGNAENQSFSAGGKKKRNSFLAELRDALGVPAPLFFSFSIFF